MLGETVLGPVAPCSQLCAMSFSVTQIKQETETNTEEQELRITINLLISEPNKKANYNVVLANNMYLQASPQKKTFHSLLQKTYTPCLGDKEQTRY